MVNQVLRPTIIRTSLDKQFFTEQDIIDTIFKLSEENGKQKLLAIKLGISETYLSDIVTRRSKISSNFARKLGFRKVTVYKRITRRS